MLITVMCEEIIEVFLYILLK